METTKPLKAAGLIALLALVSALGWSARAEQSDEALAKAAQNPVANLISVPFQDNINFNYGPEEKTQNVLNIQPVIPVSLGSDWNLITRTILPVISQPGFFPGEGRTNGIGDTQFTAFLSPAKSEGLVWGAGPILQLPTNNDKVLGNDRWGLGPSAVVLRIQGHWVYGALANNLWSVSSSHSDPSYNKFLLQPFINYNFAGGLYLSSAPIITADWKADSGDRWTVPLGGGVGKIVRFGKLPVNFQTQLFRNIEKPEFGPNWTWRLQAQLMFPK